MEFGFNCLLFVRFIIRAILSSLFLRCSSSRIWFRKSQNHQSSVPRYVALNAEYRYRCCCYSGASCLIARVDMTSVFVFLLEQLNGAEYPRLRASSPSSSATPQSAQLAGNVRFQGTIARLTFSTNAADSQNADSFHRAVSGGGEGGHVSERRRYADSGAAVQRTEASDIQGVTPGPKRHRGKNFTTAGESRPT